MQTYLPTSGAGMIAVPDDHPEPGPYVLRTDAVAALAAVTGEVSRRLSPFVQPMTLERALELNGQLTRFLVAHDIGETVSPLPTEVTLAEWLQATGLVRAENERRSTLPHQPGKVISTHLTVDGRGVAAAYVLTHYQSAPLPEPEVILVAAGKALLLATAPHGAPTDH